MNILNKLYKSNIINFIPNYFLRKLKKFFNYNFVEIPIEKLPKNNYPRTITLEGQEKLIKNFELLFKTLNFTDNINFGNFDKKYGKIEYCDLLMKKVN